MTATCIAATAATLGYAAWVTIGNSDRAHFARIAEAMSAERRARRDEDLRKSAVERIVEGLVLGAQLPTSPEREALDDARALGQAELYARAKRLGLYRP